MGLSPETSSHLMLLKLKKYNSYKDGGRLLFQMGLSPETSMSFMFPPGPSSHWRVYRHRSLSSELHRNMFGSSLLSGLTL
eukprot:9481530-Pyramimonas_sp.AAC.2